jgi:hypothetical protein
MSRNRRSDNRFEVHIVGQFKPLSKPAVSFLGITRDFSCGGFSFESQTPDLGPGDILSFRFKHPKSDIVVSTQGEIVWKRNAERFTCLMGIKFRDISASVKSSILKIMSAAGDVPVSLFLPGDDTESKKIKAAEPDQISAAASAHTEMTRGNKKRIATIIAVTGAIVLCFLLTAQFDNLIKVITGPEPDSAKTTSLRKNEYNQSLSHADKDRRESLIKEVSYQSGSDVLTTDKAGQSGPSSADIDSPTEFYVQVGTWKNPDYALETRDRLIEYYPAAYIIVEKDFHVIRIPGIMTKTEGDKIIKEIENTYNLRPLLSLKRK